MADTGEPDARLAAALGRVRAVPVATGADRVEVLAALVTARVFAAVTATSTAEHVEPGTGLRAESSAEMALFTLVGSAGGRAVPVFLDAAGAVGFRPGARPVARTGQEVCTAALQDGAVAVLLDPAGAAMPVGGGELTEVAAGRVPVAGAALSSRRVEHALTTPTQLDQGMLRALARALQGEPVSSARLLDGPDGPVLGLVPARPLDAAGLTALASRVLPRLAGRQVDVTLVPEIGPGVEVAVAPVAGRGAGGQRWWRR